MKLLTWIVERIEGETVYIKTEAGERLSLALSDIQGTPAAGSNLRILAIAEGTKNAGASELARTLLNEILSTPKT